MDAESSPTVLLSAPPNSIFLDDSGLSKGASRAGSPDVPSTYSLFTVPEVEPEPDGFSVDSIENEPSTNTRVVLEEAAAALLSTCSAAADVATALAASGSGVSSPLATSVEAFAFVSSALASISTTLAEVLIAPVLSDFTSLTTAQALKETAMKAEGRALSLVQATTDFTDALAAEMHRGESAEVHCEVSEKRARAEQLPNVKEIMNYDMENYSLSTSPARPKAFSSKYDILQKFGYTLGEVIGHGSFSVTKSAQSRVHSRKVAIKITAIHKAPKVYQEKLLPREIEAVQIVRHPNVIKYLQVIETNHCVYFVMDYAEKGNICDILQVEKFIKEPRAQKWFRQLAQAVKFIHSKGIVHRDIKCENILVDAKDDIKLCEFYFARLSGADHSKAPRMSATYCGTRSYSAPEILQRTPYDPELSDVWSMGVVLYAIVCGRLPFNDAALNSFKHETRYDVIFPKERNVSLDCQSLVYRIMTPADCRINVSEVLRDPWLRKTKRNNSKGDVVSSSTDSDGEMDFDRGKSEARSILKRIAATMKQFTSVK